MPGYEIARHFFALFFEGEKVLPAVKEFRCCLHISNAVFRNLAMFSALEQRPEIEPGDAITLWAFDAEPFAVEIEAELPERAVEGELVHQIAMFIDTVPVRKEISRWFDAVQS